MAEPESVESQTIVKCTIKLEQTLRRDMKDFATFLLQNDFIKISLYNEVLNSRLLTEDKKAEQMLSCITEEVERDSEKYHVFVDQLRNNQKRYGKIVRLLDETFDSFGGKAAVGPKVDQQSFTSLPRFGQSIRLLTLPSIRARPKYPAVSELGVNLKTSVLHSCGTMMRLSPSPKNVEDDPQQGYPGPQQGYPAPQQGYPAPQQGYAGPQQGYHAPQQGYAGPQQGYYTYGHPPPQPYNHPQYPGHYPAQPPQG